MTISLTAWITAGVCFWLSCLRHGGAPVAWASRDRYEGWSALLFFYLPFSIAFAPLLLAWALYMDLRS